MRTSDPEIFGNTRRVAAGGTLVPNGPPSFWVVVSGGLSVFVAKSESGKPEGLRRYLFDVGPGQAIFAAQPVGTLADYALLLISIERSELAIVPATEPGREFCGPASRYADEWVRNLSAHLGTLFRPRGVPEVLAAGVTTLDGRKELIPPAGEVLWTRVVAGSATWMGLESVKLTTSTPPVPLGPGMYVESDGAIEACHTRDNTLPFHAALKDSLLFLQELLFSAFALLDRREEEEEAQRVSALETLDGDLTREALITLTSITGPPAGGIVRDMTPLLSAAAEVGRALGVAICAPPVAWVGAKAADPLEPIALASRVRKRRVLLTGGWWRSDCGPLLGFGAADNRPLALIPSGATHYELLDPAEGKRVRVDEFVAALLSPTAYTFYRPLTEEASGLRGLIKFATHRRAGDLSLAVLTGLAATLLGMALPAAAAVIFDRVVPFSDRPLLFEVGAGLLAVVLGKTLFELTQSYVLLRLQTRATADTHAAVWDRLLSLPLTFFRRFSTGDLLSRAAAVSTIFRHLSANTLRTLFAGSTSLLNLVLMTYISPELTAAALAVALVTLSITAWAGVRIFRLSELLQAKAGKLLGLTVQLINGVNKLRVAGAERRAFARWSETYGEQQRFGFDIQRLKDQVNVFHQALPAVATALLFWLLISSRGGVAGLGSGAFLAFYVAFGTFLAGVTALSLVVVDVLYTAKLMERAKPILVAKPEVARVASHPGHLRGAVALEGVTFRYRDAGRLTLDRVSIQAAPGEFIALVGPSGGGKTTALRLLLGFESPQAGTVTYDGQNLAGLDVTAVRRQIGVVLQDYRISSAPIFDNIAGGALVTLDDVWAAARSAGLAEDIARMPMGMYTYISEGGTNLSGGQRQRLLIARALVSRPRILLLDEATSSLDNKTQAAVVDSLDKLNVTRIVVAHRLSTIRRAQRIYVLEAGTVAQCGTFDELSREEGVFSRLMARQSV